MKEEIEIIRENRNIIVRKPKSLGYIEEQSVQSNILFAILEKLEEIRCGIINVENKAGEDE